MSAINPAWPQQVKAPNVNLIQFSLSVGTVLCDGAVVFLRPPPPRRYLLHSRLERLPLGEESFPKRRGGGASAEGGAPQGDLGLPTGDGGGAQRGGAPAPADGRAPHGELGLPPLYAGVAQG